MSATGRNKPAEDTRSLTFEVSKVEATLEPLAPARRRAALVLISGLPGSGKSYFSRLLQDKVPLVALESDRIRQLLFGRPTYEAEESAHLFAVIHVVLERLLGRRLGVLLDATNLREADRRQLYAIGEKSDAKLILISVQAPANVIRERLLKRARRLDSLDISEAGVAVYRRMRKRMQAIQRPHIVVDTSKDVTKCVEEALSQLTDE
jgi:predicted kinase